MDIGNLFGIFAGGIAGFIGIILSLLIICLPLIINIIIAKQGVKAAKAKGHGNEAHAFAMCFWLGIIGFVYVCALPDLVARQQRAEIIEALNKAE